MSAAYHALGYLTQTKQLAIQYNANLDIEEAYIFDDNLSFFGASDASFADDRATRRSSQGYIFYLFGGPIDWKATLQRCVTKSSTESELLAASAAGTDLIWWWRTFAELGFDPGHEKILYCDNAQTVRLLTAEAPRLKTQLKHVDVHNAWLREQVQGKQIDVKWISTKAQPADGLTKLLPPQKHQNWLELLNLVDANGQ